MAEVGKGDPRWIVQDRDDGANCNNWHWTEKDILPWAKEQVTGLLQEKVFTETPKVEVRTTNISSFEGDCIIMNRKKKLICSFDLKMDVEWEGAVKDEATGEKIYTIKGKMTIPDVDDTTIGNDMQVDITCAESGDAADLVLGHVRTDGRKLLRKGMEDFALLLKDAHGVTKKAQTVTENKASASTAAKKEERGVDGCVDDFSLRMDWRCPPAELWDVLTNQGKACAYTRSQVTLNVSEGGEFAYLGGSISGTFKSVDAPKGFVMKWRLDNWDPGHFSLVEVTLDSHEAGATEMKLKHSNIPYGETPRVKEGWTRNFWEPIKGIFGFMYFLK
eukprot:TRINITY_DN18670_c0_g1_i1.p1 TRINITY_DN18670_c0_g1~~TRINITY_DN18670_c0_g1_i1.p1  ORF type:complete len:347 (+),score=169.92 TRINITY_DN18670_c0_g1_i1:47-1042(+)